MNKLLAILALGALVAPVALAHGDSSDQSAAGLYLAGLGVWQESNGDDGLQQEAHCHAGHIDDAGTPDDEADDFFVCDDNRDADSQLL